MSLDAMLNKKQLVEKTTLSYGSIFRRMRAGTFPKPVVLSRDQHGNPTRVAWRESDVRQWLENLR